MLDLVLPREPKLPGWVPTASEFSDAWAAVGVMALRCVVHCGLLPLRLCPLALSAALGQLPRLPPDLDEDGRVCDVDAAVDGDSSAESAGAAAQVRALRAERRRRGDAWVAGALEDALVLLHVSAPARARAYRWAL